MKHVNGLTWVLLAAIILLSLVQSQEILRLNAHSLQVVKASFDLAEGISYPVNQSFSIDDPTLNCHLRWFELVLKYRQQSVNPDDSIFGEVISCSLLQMRMLRKVFPTNLDIANLASQIYPEETYPIYWMIEITDPAISYKSKPLVEKILILNSKEGVAWRYLGIIYLKEMNIPAAIDAYTNSCLNGDPGYHGCNSAGKLLEQTGRYQEAIYYYRLSLWPRSREAAEKLVEELSLQSP
jgi:tetratricopeptide (TPR) repeat protein